MTVLLCHCRIVIFEVGHAGSKTVGYNQGVICVVVFSRDNKGDI